MAMKRIVVICEGPTEKEFCETILSPYFAPKGIYLNADFSIAQIGAHRKRL